MQDRADDRASDYDRITKAMAFVIGCADRQPSLREMAAHVRLSPCHFQRLFCRWAGVTPKRFLQVLTVERAKPLLREPKTVLEVSDVLGLSSGSRLYDHFVSLEAVTPGEYQTEGAGLTIEYAVHDTPFGKAFIALTPQGVCALAFLEASGPDEQLAALRKQWPHAHMRENPDRTCLVVATLFLNEKMIKPDRPLSLCVSGTNFQVSVWRALLQIPKGRVASYSQVATAIGHPHAARAVGQAVGANPIAFLIPCHRVIRESGELGGYRWGVTRKRAIQLWESVSCGSE
ncbi:MAG: methylated-DNA--[protein]-cysteine S-methyltransferase [Acidiferrobacter sp.]